jgi:hypothetical protein
MAAGDTAAVVVVAPTAVVAVVVSTAAAAAPAADPTPLQAADITPRQNPTAADTVHTVARMAARHTADRVALVLDVIPARALAAA